MPGAGGAPAAQGKAAGAGPSLSDLISSAQAVVPRLRHPESKAEALPPALREATGSSTTRPPRVVPTMSPRQAPGRFQSLLAA